MNCCICGKPNEAKEMGCSIAGPTLSKKEDSFCNASASLAWACAVVDIECECFAKLVVPACDPMNLSAFLFLSDPV